ncbi:hypothetical protein FN846DRAFT_904962 [Sphaerosporella brunnea]|uniref:Polynucleotide 5'-hydroxyl-kinase GRC3 n=1 Tax=Sphaerosporella brunnea TaxID=1250544 RepID=A0A5J5F3C8_9PEZI|nr:hypothetical protein FN846DRAFT_904962 [Sphaerosporella brunnea]
MPKRTREEAVKPAPRLSAVAQRRLRAAAAAAPPHATPEPARKPKPEKSVSNEELAQKRAEIEGKIAGRVRVLQGGGPAGVVEATEELSPARASPEGSSVTVAAAGSPSGRGEESALARIKRQRQEKRLDEDVEMLSPGEESEEDDVMGTTAESAAPVPSQFSSFVPTDENYNATNSSMTFRLQPGETLVLVGIYEIAVTKGSITISGAKLSDSSPKQTIYAPTTHALPVIEAPSKRRRDGSEKYLGAEIRITSHHSGLADIGKLCPTFNGVWKRPSKDHDSRSFSPIYSSTVNVPTLTIPSAWKTTLSSLLTRCTDGPRPPTILLTGSKSAGKSTFSRIFSNTLLTSGGVEGIAYLDIDPGQPEFTPPGSISLSILNSPILGPPFTHTHIPVRWHHIGYTSPREDPGHYINSIIDLLSAYRQQYASTPLIINTMGWTKGLGLELLQDILVHSQASDIIFLGNGAQSVSELVPPNTATFHELPSAAVAGATRFTPADLRTLHTMSYFHRQGLGDWNFSTPLTAIAPWMVPFTGPNRGVDAVHIMGEFIAPSEIVTAVEGTIVGIVVVAEHNFPGSSSSDVALPVLTAPLAPDVAECRGLAIIRAVDSEQGLLQMVSTVAQEEVERWDKEGLKVVLVRGRLELSPWEMIVPGGGGNGEIPWVSTVLGTKGRGAVWRVRRNVMRRGQQ